MSFVMLLTLGLHTSMRSLSSIASLSLSSAAYRHEVSLVMSCQSCVVIHYSCTSLVTLVGLCVLLKSLCACKWCVATGFHA